MNWPLILLEWMITDCIDRRGVYRMILRRLLLEITFVTHINILAEFFYWIIFTYFTGIGITCSKTISNIGNIWPVNISDVEYWSTFMCSVATKISMVKYLHRLSLILPKSSSTTVHVASFYTKGRYKKRSRSTIKSHPNLISIRDNAR